MAHRETQSRLTLPPVPIELAGCAVAAWSEPVTIDSYLPEAPDRFPAFLETRVYQGSSGRVFPLPFHERIGQRKEPHVWQAVHLENRWLRLMILPELGGRIHVAYDKIGDYDIFYRNNVIKPALVGLAGPWISGGVEFNWPQHHRPATFLPTDVSIEEEPDGSVTVWCSDHDPFARMKGMHGIRLRPDSSRIEARVRLFNRSETTQTFLWWANVAAAVNDDYQSFFPIDVAFVADHAKRAVVTFPEATMPYYGVDYQARVTAENPSAARLDWYRNIPVPTSYMVMSSADGFFGGYDHGRAAGFVHFADRTISPGKKQWTWGNSPFGWAWDRNLTDADGPYVELMAGVFTDNQPDFAYLAPGETKTFSQFWYPIREIGPATQASSELAASLTVGAEVVIGLHAAVSIRTARIRLETLGGRLLLEQVLELTPDLPRTLTVRTDDDWSTADLRLTVTDCSAGRTLLRIDPPASGIASPPSPATEPPLPHQIESIDELVQIASYLDQYRHATRSAIPYWSEALSRDPHESRASAALGAHAYRSGSYDEAARLFQDAVDRRTRWASTPLVGDAHYGLGLVLLRLGRRHEAREALARASWDTAFAAAAKYLLARESARDRDYHRAIDVLNEVLETDADHLQARDLLALVLGRVGRTAEAADVVAHTLRLDPLDAWALHISGRAASSDATTLLDVALEYASAGFHHDALGTLDDAEERLLEAPLGQVNVGPLLGYHRAAILHRAGDREAALRAAADASTRPRRNALPSRLDDIDALTVARQLCPSDPVAPALLGHWYYDRRRYQDAIASWTMALNGAADPELVSVLHRNLGIAAYNILREPSVAEEHYSRALAAAPDDAKLWQESDQLAARTGVTTEERLERLAQWSSVVSRRDDLTVTYAGLLVQSNRAAEAWQLLRERNFQPWEGGEGQALDAWDRTCFALADSAIDEGDPARAVNLLEQTLQPPQNLGEARHPLANVSEHHLRLGDAWAAAGDDGRAKEHWEWAAASVSDFTRMATMLFSPQTVFAIVALQRLGRLEEAADLTTAVEAWADEYAAAEAKIDYFATSLPTMLLFIDDPAIERDREVARIRSQLSALRCGEFDRLVIPCHDDDMSMATPRASV